MDVRSCEEAFCEYAEYMRGFTRDTIRRYRCAIDAFLGFAQAKEMEGLTPELVRAWFFRGRTEKQWKAATFLTYHRSLVVFFRWCVKNGRIASSPMSDIELPRLARRLPPKLTQEQAMRLLESVYNYPYKDAFLRFRNHAIMATFIFSGIRKQELLNLKYADADLANGSLFVRQGKGNKDRVVPIANRLKEILARYLAERQRHRKTCPEYFTSSTLNRGLSDSGLRLLVARVRKASGIRFTIHMLRHTFATLMLEGGCDIYSLSRMMGHESITTTTIYLAASAQHLRSQITKHPLNNMPLH